MFIRSILRRIPCVRENKMKDGFIVHGNVHEVYQMAAACMMALEKRGMNTKTAQEKLFDSAMDFWIAKEEA